eukprot:scaffold58625_cov59-Phaeocystis_antarctica.AAC.5
MAVVSAGLRLFHSPVRHSSAASCPALLRSAAPLGCVCSCTTTVSSGRVTVRLAMPATIPSAVLATAVGLWPSCWCRCLSHAYA